MPRDPTDFGQFDWHQQDYTQFANKTVKLLVAAVIAVKTAAVGTIDYIPLLRNAQTARLAVHNIELPNLFSALAQTVFLLEYHLTLLGKLTDADKQQLSEMANMPRHQISLGLDTNITTWLYNDDLGANVAVALAALRAHRDELDLWNLLAAAFIAKSGTDPGTFDDSAKTVTAITNLGSQILRFIIAHAELHAMGVTSQDALAAAGGKKAGVRFDFAKDGPDGPTTVINTFLGQFLGGVQALPGLDQIPDAGPSPVTVVPAPAQDQGRGQGQQRVTLDDQVANLRAKLSSKLLDFYALDPVLFV